MRRWLWTIILMAIPLMSQASVAGAAEPVLRDEQSTTSDSSTVTVLKYEKRTYRVELSDGSKLVGKIARMTDDGLLFRTDNGESREISWSAVVSLRQKTEYTRTVIYAAISAGLLLCCLTIR